MNDDVMQFGIPSFDALFGRRRAATTPDRAYDYGAYGIQLTGEKKTTSMCLIGPDGTGKSVFGLHLATQYMAAVAAKQKDSNGAEEKEWHPRVLYVSTDLKHHVADVMWTNFGLKNPNQRDFPFYWAYRRNCSNPTLEVPLTKLDPADPAAIQSAVLEDHSGVYFVDLVSKTMGDDWGFINRLLAVLRTPVEGCAPHLLIIDAVEGFETLVGEKDAFGEITSRRARIAQIMRTAGEKCHVCFIVEEPKNDERFPEEFVTDVVVRLRNVEVNKYSRRTVEIVKARGQSHVRGQHSFVIRESKSKLSAEEYANADEPGIENSYLHVFPSLHYLSREGMKSRGRSNRKRDDRVAAFGFTYLDEMLARLGERPPGLEDDGLDDQGLPVQTTTALIGEIATQKTSLATAFLARTFRPFIFGFARIIRELNQNREFTLIQGALMTRLSFASTIQGTKTESEVAQRVNRLMACIRQRDTEGLTRNLNEWRIPSQDLSLNDLNGIVHFAAWLAEALPDSGAAVLVTTSDQDREGLVEELERWLEKSKDKALQNWPTLASPLGEEYSEPFSTAIRDHLRLRTICRRLELHDLSSATLFQIIQRSVERAQHKVFLSDDMEKNMDRLPFQRAARFSRSWSIRVVLDDLSALKDAYPEIGSDPIFLPFLLSFLELEGVTSLIINSQPGRPDAPVNDPLDRELRALVPHKILTWRVSFFGGMRDAITVVPPYPNGLPSLVREVRWQAGEGERNVLVVDPEFELYAGLGRGDPRPIPLEVRLYGATGPAADYIREQNETFGRLFTPLGIADSQAKVIIGVEPGQYDSLRDFCNLHIHTMLNHTMVLQIDEFWAASRGGIGPKLQSQRGAVSRREGTLYPLGRYFTEFTSAKTRSNKLIADRVADPFGVFQGVPITGKASFKEPGPWRRRDYFTHSAKGRPKEPRFSELAEIDRVPYARDFGFLLCPSSMWEFATNRKIGYENLSVGDVWSQMPSVLARKPQQYVSWRKFLGACKTVAHVQGERSSCTVRVFDIAALPEESFSCLMIEIWASEIFDMLSEEKKAVFLGSFGHIDWDTPGSESLIDWLDRPDYLLAFYKTWLLLVDVITLSDAIERQGIPRLKIREADGSAVAARHWYKTACGHQHCSVTNEPALPVRLPGHFSVRGDCFLAVAGGSRSERLACRAIDLLSTRRANFRRMELGIGLPTRDIAPRAKFDELPTALVKCDPKGQIKYDPKGQITAVTYGELIGVDIERAEYFSWFWRSQLRDYHRHSLVVQRWIGQLVAKWEVLRDRLGSEWKSGFDIYDSLQAADNREKLLKTLDSWEEFEKMCRLLTTQLVAASGSAPRSEHEAEGPAPREFSKEVGMGRATGP